MERHRAPAPERQLQNDLAASDIAVVVLGSDHLILYVSDGYCRLVGKAREELIGARAEDARIASSAERTRWILDRAPDVGSAMMYRRAYETDSGVKLVDVHMHRAADDVLVVTLLEIGDEDPEAADRILGSFMDAVPLGVVIYDRELRIQRVNRIVEELGRVRPEHVGRTLREAFPDVDPAVTRAIDHVLTTGEEIVNLPVTRPDGHSLLLNFFPVGAPGGPVEQVGCLFSDVTEFAEAHETIPAQREQIRELATPVIELEDRVLVAPLVGTLDPRRLADLTDRLLAEVSRLRAGRGPPEGPHVAPPVYFPRATGLRRLGRGRSREPASRDSQPPRVPARLARPVLPPPNVPSRPAPLVPRPRAWTVLRCD